MCFSVSCICIKACANEKCLVTKHFNVWPPCLVLFGRVWLCSGHQTFDQKLKTFLLFLCLTGDVFVCLDSRVSNIFDAGMSNHAFSAACINCFICVLSVFYQTCFNRLATHFNISMFIRCMLHDNVC